jgi:hypothetical protein
MGRKNYIDFVCSDFVVARLDAAIAFLFTYKYRCRLPQRLALLSDM